MSSDENEKLISIDEFIKKAKNLGIDFGKGDPKNRLRYYVKIGLLPHALRKSFNGLPPNGAYPEKYLEILFEIDRKLKAGKSIQKIKREKEEDVGKFFPLAEPIFEIQEAAEGFKPEISTPTIFKKRESSHLLFLKRNIFPVLITIFLISFIFSFYKSFDFSQRIFNPFFATLSQLVKKSFVQIPKPPEIVSLKEKILSPAMQPYLTINAETDINAPLNVKEEITVPRFVLTKDGLEGKIVLASLTSDREYIFPDASGTVCLTTGNCFGIFGEVTTRGGLTNRLAKFTNGKAIGNSSINDLYNTEGVVITINEKGYVGIGAVTPRAELEVAGNLITTGKIGVGIEKPLHSLHVVGKIQATGDICTNLAGGRCLSTLSLGGGGRTSTVISGIDGWGSSRYLSVWTESTTLSNSVIYQTEDGKIGLGTTSPLATLTVSGDGYFLGPLNISTPSLSQLVLKYDNDNYLNFSITSTSSTILASKTIVLNSLTGEIILANGVNYFKAPITTISGKTFLSDSNDATVRKSGELILRASLPIFKFPVPAQTNSVTAVAITRQFSSSELNSVLPDVLPGTTRYFAFLLNFTDDIPLTDNSTWVLVGPDIEFYFRGQNSTLEEGIPHLSNLFSPPGVNWQLKVRVPPGRTIRIFNIFLLVFDKVN